MIIERIKIQFHIHKALLQAKKANPQITQVAEKALTNLNKSFKKLELFNQKHPFFSRLFRWIDHRFGFNPLRKEMKRLAKPLPIQTPSLKTPKGSVEIPMPTIPHPEKPIPADPINEPELKTPEGSIEVPLPVFPNAAFLSEEEKSGDSASIEETAEKEPIQKNDELTTAIQDFKSKYAACFDNDANLQSTFDAALAHFAPQKRLKYLEILQNYQNKTEKWIPAETYLSILLENHKSAGELLYFIEDVYEKRSEISAEKLEDEMDLYISDLFDHGLYWLPKMEELLTQKRVEAFLLNESYETESTKAYIQSIYDEVKDHNHFMIPYLESCLKQINKTS